MVDTSHSLLQRLKQGDDPADWERLVAVYTPWIAGWLRRHNVTDVDDIVQDVMVVMFEKIKQYEHNQRKGAFRNYLRKVTFHRLSQQLRKRKAQAIGGSQIQQLLQQLDDPHSALSRQWEVEHDRFVMRRLFASLRESFEVDTWRAFERLMLDGVSAQQVAEELSITVNAVYIAKSRVLKRLRDEAEGMVNEDAW
ncbi:MAG: sigma-70 family RNA polymerase sigma factor [Planctomycetales bacterium]|nr:sigma-70 family RNA polymerase sigma factor [Planctomycetales bacterium]